MELTLARGRTEIAMALAASVMLVLMTGMALHQVKMTPAGFDTGFHTGSVSINVDLSAPALLAPEEDGDSQAAGSVASSASEAAPEPVQENMPAEPVIDPNPQPVPEPEQAETALPEPEKAEPPPVELVEPPEPTAVMAPRPRPKPVRAKPNPPVEPERVPEPEKAVEKMEPRPQPIQIPAEGEQASNANAVEGVSDVADQTVSNADSQVGDSRKQASALPADQAGGSRARGDYWGAVGQRLKELQTYPRKAKRRSIEGIALLKLTLNADGTIAGYEILESSGSRLLDNSVLKMVQEAGRFPPFPPDIREITMTRRIPVRFFLQ